MVGKNMILQLISLCTQGYSDSEIAEILNLNRKTVARYRKLNEEYRKALEKEPQNRQIREEYFEFLHDGKKYDGSARPKRAYTEQIDARVRQILEEDEKRLAVLGLPSRRRISARQIFETIIEEGYMISYSTISHEVAKIRSARPREVFIRQEYPYGQTAQYDYGFVDIIVRTEKQTRWSMAVIVLPASGFVWVWIYRNQKADTFQDSHNRFFELVGGVPRRIVYDNMKNVVSRFVGKNEKELSDTVLTLAAFYGFEVVTTNAYRGNEKGRVERDVQWVRDRLFTRRWEFDTVEELNAHVETELEKLNRNHPIDEERKYLKPRIGTFEISRIVQPKADKYCTVRIDQVRYSVPDHLVGKKLTARVYPEEVRIYHENELVASHQRAFARKGEREKWVIDYRHYIPTLEKKPGAFPNSRILVEWPELKTLCEDYFNSDYRKFTAFLRENAHLPMEALIQRAHESEMMEKVRAEKQKEPESGISAAAGEQIRKAQGNFVGKGKKNEL